MPPRPDVVPDAVASPRTRTSSSPTSTDLPTRTFDGGRPLPKPTLVSPNPNPKPAPKPSPDISVAGRTAAPIDRTSRGNGRTAITPTGSDSTGTRARTSLPPVPPVVTGDTKGDLVTNPKPSVPDLSTGTPTAIPPSPPPSRDFRSDDWAGNGTGSNHDTIVVNGDVFVNNGTVNVWNGTNGWWYPDACGWGPSWNWCGNPWWNTCGGWGGGWSLGFAFSSGGFGFSLGYSSGWGGCAWPGPWYGCGPAWGGWYGWGGGCSPYVGPWWGTSISLVNCGWYPSVPCWNPCGPWWGGYACSPYLAWAPYSTIVAVTVPVEPVTVVTVVEDPPATVAVLAPPTAGPVAPMGAVESEAWALLAEGFPRTAAELFASLHDDRPGDPRPLAGYAIALANLGDGAGAAATLRRAVAIDASTLGRLPISPELAARLQGLESAARVTTRQAAATADAYFLLACWRTMLGRSTEAHFAATLAVEKGDGSAGTARFRDWLANVG